MKLDRRQFFRVTAVGGAAVGLDACSTVVPSPRRRTRRGPEKRVVTACGGCSAGCGIRVRVVGDDVVGIDGLEGHPVNDGALCARGIAEIQNLYHPERLRAPLARTGGHGAGELAEVDWDGALQRFAGRVGKVVVGLGDCSAAEAALVARIAAQVGALVVPARAPYSEMPVDAIRGLLGSDRYRYDYGAADYVVSLGADWIATSTSPVQSQRAFARLRRMRGGEERLVAVGPRLSTTAGKSDRWVPVRSDQLASFGLSLAHVVLKERPAATARGYAGFDELAAVASGADFAPERVAERIGIEPEQIERTAAALLDRPHALVVTDRSDPTTQWIGVVLNLLIGAVDREGGLVRAATAPLPEALVPPRPLSHVRAFPSDLSGATVLIVRANPVYAMPAASGWRAGLERAQLVVDISAYADETAQLADVVLPQSTALESPQLTWGSVTGGAGFVAAGPAVSEPLYDTRTTVDILLAVAGRLGVELPWSSGEEYLAGVAEALSADELLGSGGVSELAANAAAEPELPQEVGAAGAGDGQDAVGAAPVADSSAGEAAAPEAAAPVEAIVAEPPAESPPPSYRLTAAEWRAAAPAAAEPTRDLPLRLEVHEPVAFRGGLGAHLPYLHGLTDAFEREVWRTVAEVNPTTAARLGVSDGQPVEIVSTEARVEAIVRLRQGIRPDSVGIATGLGRRGLGVYCDGHGANPLELLGGDGPTFVRMEKKS